MQTCVCLLNQKHKIISNSLSTCPIQYNNEFFNNKLMKKLLIVLTSILLIFPSYADTIQGGVSERGVKGQNRIIDKQTGEGIGGAKITLPKEKFQTKTNKDGYFELDTQIEGTSIMSIQKDKYKPYSLTVTQKTFDTPLEVSIEKSDAHNITIDTSMHHLGDNSFSDNSANAGEFQSYASGPFFAKKFNLKGINTHSPIYLVIGSIIGIDTLMARSMGQNRHPNAYASPTEVYFNGNKIADVQINGDGQKIKLPSNLVKKGINEVMIKTGRNLMQTSYIDYDDIEFMNLSIEN